MTTQETITNALASGSIAALAAALALAVLVWLGADWAMNTLDVHLPVRQLVLGSSGRALAMHGRVVYTLVIARLARSRLRPARQPWRRFSSLFGIALCTAADR